MPAFRLPFKVGKVDAIKNALDSHLELIISEKFFPIVSLHSSEVKLYHQIGVHIPFTYPAVLERRIKRFTLRDYDYKLPDNNTPFNILRQQWGYNRILLYSYEFDLNMDLMFRMSMDRYIFTLFKEDEILYSRNLL